MIQDGYEFVTECVTKFHKTIYVEGWFNHRSDTLATIELQGPGICHQIGEVGTHFGGPDNIAGRSKGFRLQCLRDIEALDGSCILILVSARGKRFEVPLQALADDRDAQKPHLLLYTKFKVIVNLMKAPRLLDVGGRNRSRYDRGAEFPNTQYTVLDILAGDNVDVVGDAHALSRHFPRDHFDAVISFAVFEHLAMPWKVALEMNKVMKMGAAGIIFTHQTVGLHDMPWDFWRFSEYAWDSLFNKYTGFRIVDRAMDTPQFVLPFRYIPAKHDCERSAGFEWTGVLFQKVGDTQLSWEAPLDEIIKSSYPGGTN